MVAHLARTGWDVTGVDVKSGADCRDVFRYDTGRFDLVVHLAAVVGGRQMIEQQPMAVATDLAIDSDFFQYVIRTRPARSVYFSSSAAYPVQYQQPSSSYRLQEFDVDLGDAREPDAVYGWAKLTGERLAAYANAEHNAGIYVFRPFSGYGGDQDLTYPFPAIMHRASQRPAQMSVWGSGTQVRDWVHIDDVVQSVTQTLEWDPTVVGTRNICTGVGTSMIDLAGIALSQLGHDVEITTQPDQPHGVHYRVGDPTLSHGIYVPAISIEEGVHRALTSSP